jgi:hypothetical protein
MSLARRALKDKFPTPTVPLATVSQNRQVFLPDPVGLGFIFINIYMVLFLSNNVIYVFYFYDYVFLLYVYVWLP